MGLLFGKGGIFSKGRILDVGCDTGGFTSEQVAMRKIMEAREEIAGPPRHSFLDHLTNKYVDPGIGTVVLCDLSPIPGLSAIGLNVEHTGIYVGDGKIIHRSGDGYLEKVTPKEFLDRLGGINAAISVYVACKGKNSLVIKSAYERAKEALYDPQHEGYKLFSKNCHNFSSYCLTGDLNQSDYTFTSLQLLLKDKFEMDDWRIWNYQ